MISVVIPCYNAASTIDATLDSALMQNVELEVVVVNDGSTDRSGELLSRRADTIRVITTPNRGASAARAAGTEAARGQFIQYLDSDDMLIEGTLSARLAALANSHAEVVHTDWQRFTTSGHGEIILGETMKPDLAAIEIDAEIATATSRFWAPPAALLYRRSVVERIGNWHMGLPIIQDARFLFDAAAQGAQFVHVPKVGALYRIAPNSLSRASNAKFITDCALNAEEIEAMWRSRGSISELHCEALDQMWGHVASVSLLNGLDTFDCGRAGLNRLAKPRLIFEMGHLLRLAFGATVTGTLSKTALAARKTIKKILQHEKV